MIAHKVEDNVLEKLKEELKECRSSQIDPVTKIWWDMLSEIYLKLLRDNTQEKGKILDVGCGVGTYIVALSKINRIGFGIDPLFETSLLKAQQKAKDDNVNVSLIQSVSENLPFEDETFDVVLHLSTLQHVNNQDKTLSEIKRVLKDNGFLLVSVPTNRNISTLFMRSKKPEYVTKPFDIGELKKIMTEMGFKTLKIRGCGFFPPFSHKVLFVCYRLFGVKTTRRIIELLDVFAKGMPITASSVVAICKTVKEVSDE